LIECIDNLKEFERIAKPLTSALDIEAETHGFIGEAIKAKVLKQSMKIVIGLVGVLIAQLTEKAIKAKATGSL
jgi:hypothetical protein